FGIGGGDAVVRPQPLAGVRYVILRDRYIDTEIDRHIRLVRDLFAAKFGDRAVEHLCVQDEPERVQMSELLAAENVSRASKLHIVRGNAKPGAEIGKFADRAQPAAGDGREFEFTGNEQICIRPAVRTPDAAAKLIKLRKAVIVG